MSTKKFRKISHSEQEISIYLSYFSKEMRQLTEWQTYKKFRIILIHCKFIPGKPPKIFRKISHPVQEIYLHWPYFSKKVSQLAEWQTYKKFRIIWNKCTNIPGLSPKNFRKISYTDPEIPQYFCNFSKKVSQ